MTHEEIHRESVKRLTPMADFLKTHNIFFDENKMMWVIYNRYCYTSIQKLIQDEMFWPLMHEVYKLSYEDLKTLETPALILFHDLGLVKDFS